MILDLVRGSYFGILGIGLFRRLTPCARLVWAHSMLLLTGGCAPTLSTFTPAHVAKAGHVQAEVGADLSVPSGALSDLVDVGKAAIDAAQGERLSDPQVHQVLDASASLLLNPPSMNTHLGIGVGILQNWEVSGRLVSGGWRLGSRYELLHQPQHGITFSAGIGVGHYSWAAAALEQLNDLNDTFGLDLVHYDEYSRWQFDIPLLIGKSGTWYRWWTGPKILLCTYDTRLTVTPGNNQAPLVFGMDGLSSYLGAVVGAALGYKYVFFAAELTLVRFDTKAHFAATGGATAGAYDAKIGGLVVYPGFGLMGEF